MEELEEEEMSTVYWPWVDKARVEHLSEWINELQPAICGAAHEPAKKGVRGQQICEVCMKSFLKRQKNRYPPIMAGVGIIPRA